MDWKTIRENWAKDATDAIADGNLDVETVNRFALKGLVRALDERFSKVEDKVRAIEEGLPGPVEFAKGVQIGAITLADRAKTILIDVVKVSDSAVRSKIYELVIQKTRKSIEEAESLLNAHLQQRS